MNHEERKREQIYLDLAAAAKAFKEMQVKVGWLAPIQYFRNTETGELVVYCDDETSSRKLLEFIKTL